MATRGKTKYRVKKRRVVRKIWKRALDGLTRSSIGAFGRRLWGSSINRRSIRVSDQNLEG